MEAQFLRRLAQVYAAQRFDPEGDEYDFFSALAAGLESDETGHWPSRVPDTGLLLKGKSHPTFWMTERGEEEAGYHIYKKGDRYYSKPIPRVP